MVVLGLLLSSPTAHLQQPAAQLRLIRVVAGPAGIEKDGVFTLTHERTTFSRTDDKEVIVLFTWEGVPGRHRMVGTWRSPDGSLATSSVVEYEARDRRFGSYWRLALTPTTTLGTWTIDASVDGQAAGRLAFEITDATPPPAPPIKRVLTQRELYELLSRVHLVLERSTSGGRRLEPASALLDGDGRLYTTAAVLDDVDRLVAFRADGSSHPLTTMIGWNRREQWAVLAGGPRLSEKLTLASTERTGVGDRCFSMDGTASGGRVLMEGTISGQTMIAGAPPRLVATFFAGFVRAGSPVVNESGEFLGIVGGTPDTIEMMRLQGELRGAPILPFNAFRVHEAAAPVELVTLRAKGETLAPVTGEDHIRSGGFAPSVPRGATTAPPDVRQEFRIGEKSLAVFVVWNPRERLRGMLTMRLHDAERRIVAESKPARRDLRQGQLVLASWEQAMPSAPGLYRADVLLDDRIMWRGYVRLVK